VLAVPDDKGFGLAAWLVPIAAALAALVALMLAARRWRRSVVPAGAGDAPQAAPDESEEWRLDRELSAFDRRGRV